MLPSSFPLWLMCQKGTAFLNNIFPLQPVILPQSSEIQACADLSASGVNLLLEVNRDIKLHFKEVYTHTCTHGIVFKDIVTHLPYHSEQGLFTALLFLWL